MQHDEEFDPDDEEMEDSPREVVEVLGFDPKEIDAVHNQENVMRASVQESNEKILDFLQEAVNAETATRNLYWARSVYWRSVGMSKLADYYLEQSQEDHAQRSADRMAFLGRQPTVEPTSVNAVEESVSEQLRVDLQVEIALADSYARWIEAAEEARDYVTCKMWWGVLRNTQEHVDLLQGWLKQIELMGEANWLATWRSKDDRGMA
jgi:bacterioferritin